MTFTPYQFFLIICASLFSTSVFASKCDAQVYSVKASSFIDWSAFMIAVEHADIVAIGEEHGIKAHTNFAACLINQLDAPQKHALVVEQISSDQQNIIDDYRNEHPELVSGLGKELKWWQTGWPAWHIYLPLFNSVWQRKVKLIAGDMPRVNHANDVVHNLIKFHGEDYKTIHDIWKNRLYSVYCDNISADELEQQIVMQMFRDLHMTQKVVQATSRKYKVLYYCKSSASMEQIGLVA